MASQPVSLNDVPLSVLRGLSAHFDFADLLRCQQVCRSWLRAFQEAEVVTGLLGSTLIITLEGPTLWRIKELSPAQICALTLQLPAGPDVINCIWEGSFCLWWQKYASDIPHLHLDMSGQGCERMVDGLLDAFVKPEAEVSSRTLALHAAATLLTSERCHLWAGTLTRLTTFINSPQSQFAPIAQLTQLTHLVLFLQHGCRETESSQCWTDLASLTVLRELRLGRFASAKAALLATILNIEHCEIADPPEGQVFEGSGCTQLTSLSFHFRDSPQTILLPQGNTVQLRHLDIDCSWHVSQYTLSHLHAASLLTSLHLRCAYPRNFHLQSLQLSQQYVPSLPDHFSNASLLQAGSLPACMHSLHTVSLDRMRFHLPAALLAYTALRELNLTRCHLHILPGFIGGLTQLTKLVVTSGTMKKVPSCVLKLHQLVELTIMTMHLSTNIVQLASWPDLRCLEIGVMHYYYTRQDAAVTDRKRGNAHANFAHHAHALKEAFLESHPEAIVRIYSSKKFEDLYNSPSIRPDIRHAVQQDWLMKVLV